MGYVVMESGYQVFDASGNILVDIGDAVGKGIGYLNITSASGSTTISALAGRRVFFVVDQVASTGGSTEVTINSSGTITWNWRGVGAFTNCIVVYGVY